MPNICAEERDKTSPVWDMSQERQLTEQIIAQRFNFFLVFFSIVLAGAVNAKVQLHMQLILTIGSLVAIILTRALERTSGRLDVIIALLRKDPTHPYCLVSAEMQKRGEGQGVRIILWRGLPILCTSCLWLAAVLSWFELLSVKP